MKKEYTTNSTKFKLVCYYSHKPDGTPYTYTEMQCNRNRKYHDSYDYIHGVNNTTVTRHDLAHDKLVNHVSKNREFIKRAYLYMNDHEKKLEVLIGVWDNLDVHKSRLCNIRVDMQGNNVICLEADGGGISTSAMRINTIKAA